MIAKVQRCNFGFTLLEVLITLVVVAVGILGLAALQGRTHLAAVEASQRAQAVTVSNDVISRISLNRARIDDYVTVGSVGNVDNTSNVAELDDCVASFPVDSADSDARAAQRAARDMCEWSNILRGASDQTGSSNIGAMIGARGCVELIQAAGAPPSCQPAILQVTAAWQGLVETAAPSLTCGQGEFGDDRLRRAVATRIVVGRPSCL